MNKEKLIVLARKRLWHENGATETALHNNSINEIIEFIQSDMDQFKNECQILHNQLMETEKALQEVIKERDYWKNETQEMVNIADKNINEKLKVQEERDYWELEAKKYCAALGEQKIKQQQEKCCRCKLEDTSKCKKC